MYEYNRSTGVLRDRDKRKREVELTPSEMKIAEVLFDWRWHSMAEIEEKTGIEGQQRRMHISRMKKKIKRYIEIKIDRKERRYKCERTKREQERR